MILLQFLALAKLDVGKNKITHVEGLEQLSQLSQLSLEDNDIASLAPLARISSLMELYIGNNRLVALKEVPSLRELPKLEHDAEPSSPAAGVVAIGGSCCCCCRIGSSRAATCAKLGRAAGAMSQQLQRRS